ncbi:MAG: response regulator [Rhodocyclaceae bacterium]|nr:response regulator [Rhodocyclaceae bacterium]
MIENSRSGAEGGLAGLRNLSRCHGALAGIMAEWRRTGTGRLPAELGSLLRSLIEAARLEGAVAVQHTALAFLRLHQGLGGQPLSPEDRNQVLSLFASLQRIQGGGQCQPEPAVALITPTAPSRATDNPRVALYVDGRAMTALVTDALKFAGYQVTQIESMRELASMPADRLPVAIVADLSRCRSDPDTRQVMDGLRKTLDPAPYLFCLAGSDAFDVRLEAVRLGATRFLGKPVDVEKLVAVLMGVTERRRREPFRVVFVDDDRALTEVYSAAMLAEGFQVQVCNDPRAALPVIMEFRPDVIVTDMYMPGCNGLELAAVLRQDEGLTDTPILFLSSEGDLRQRMAALDLGADDFLVKPLDLDVLASAVVARAKRARMLKRTRREQGAAAERLRQMELAVNAHSIVSITDTHGNILYVNQQFCKISGYGREEMVGQTHRKVRSGLHSRDFYRVLWDTLNRGQTWSGQLCNRARDGSHFWVETTITPQLDDRGVPIRFISAATDITMLKDLEDKLLESAGRVRSIMDIAGDVIFLVDEEGRVADINPAIQNLLGYRPDELLGQSFLLTFPEAERDKAASALCRSFELGFVKGSRELWHKEGRPVPSAIHANTGTIGGRRYLIGTIRDMTVQKQFETELLVAKLDAERANRAKSDFLANMSHELRTPLNSILGFAQLLQNDPQKPLDAERAGLVEIIVKAGWHLLDLINEVLDLSKIEAGHLEMRAEPVDISEAVQECLVLVVPMARKRRIEVLPPAGDPRAWILADHLRLKQVLLNLMSNAVKYNREAGEIGVSVVPVDGAWRISVTDTGAGIPESRRHEVFQPFSRLDAARKDIEGTGIGLVLTRRLVEMMGGRMDFASEEGRGSCFWFELPATAPPPSQSLAQADGGADAGRSAAPAGSRHGVLHVEDNANNARLVEHLLSAREALDVHFAQTGAEALELARILSPSLILVDLHLPDMTGLQVIERLKGDPATRRIPVVVLSADVRTEVHRAVAQAGAARFIAKPFRYQELLAVVDELLAVEPGAGG